VAALYKGLKGEFSPVPSSRGRWGLRLGPGRAETAGHGEPGSPSENGEAWLWQVTAWPQVRLLTWAGLGSHRTGTGAALGGRRLGRSLPLPGLQVPISA
jgi:hypothetical protein